ncbi:MAG: C1 family peptidase [Firmicutes bacterium]|nr:C1 family peptidase [Bacillota bacterium]
MKLKKGIFIIAALLQIGAFSCFSYADDALITEEGHLYENGSISKFIIDDNAPLDRIEQGRDTFAGEETSYNADIEDLKYVTPIKNQGKRGTCWAMASMSAAESAYMKTNNITDKNAVDFSEEHLVEGVYGKNAEMTYVRGTTEGGSCQKADSYFTRRTNDEKKIYGGPVADSDLEYILPETKTTPEYSDEMNFERLAYVNNFSEKDYIEYSNGSWKGIKLDSAELAARNAKIKEWLETNGAVPVDIFCGESSGNNIQGFYKNSDNKIVFYQNDLNSTANHSVTIVGYDDSVDVRNFSDYETYNSGETEDDSHYAPVPKNNGAFIVANSWGSTWGSNGGYFYMSYETHIDSIYSFSDVIDLNDNERRFDEIYEYEPFAQGSTIGFRDKAYYCGGNIFEKSAYNYEEVSKIGIYVPKSQTRVKLYCDGAVKMDEVENDNIETAYDGLTRVEAKSTSTEVEDIDSGKEFLVKTEGYYVFELKNPIKIEDTGFSVAAYYERDIAGNLFPSLKNSGDSTGYKFTKNGYSMFGEDTSRMVLDSVYTYPVKAYTNQYTGLSVDAAELFYVRVNNSLNELYGDTAKNVKFYTVWDYDDETDIETYMPFDKDEKFADVDLYLLTDAALKGIYGIGNVADIEIAAIQGNKESNSDNIRFVAKINTSDFPGNTKIKNLYYVLYTSDKLYAYDTTGKFYTNGVSDYAAKEGEILFVSQNLPVETVQNNNFDSVSVIMEIETEEDIFRINSAPVEIRQN